ncbi:MAG: rod-binding protein [Spirochaetaceae bacterium]|jgi:flagellar protein FlgJ|nr:rod-binding protein [Spirochaetaceae bacterium]
MAVTDAAAYRLDNNRYSPDFLDRLSGGTAGSPVGGALSDRMSAGGADFSKFLKADAPDKEAEGVRPSLAKPFIDKNDKLYEQCEALETFLLKTLINGMRKTVDKSEFNKGGFAGEMYEDMLYDEYAKDFTRNAKFGLAELAYLELSGQRGKALTRY